MFTQREVYRSAVSMTFGQTYELDLPKSGYLLGLALVMSSTQLASACVDVAKWRLLDYISKIELIGDGSEPIKSLSGVQALASAYYDSGVIPASQWRNYSSVPHRQTIPILFGRSLRDKNHFLDLGRFNSVSLKITNDASSTYFTTDVKLTVILYWLREPTSATGLGYFREELWKEWAPAASGIEYSILPTSLPIRRILLQAVPGKDSNLKNYVGFYNLMSDIELTLRTGQTRVFKGSLDQLMRVIHDELGFMPTVHVENYNSAGKAFETGIGYVLGAVGAPGTYGAVSAYVDTYLRDDNNDSSQYCNDRQADCPINVVVSGLCFCHACPLFTSVEPDDSDMLRPDVEKDVKLDIATASTATITSAKNGIILSRLVS